MTGTNDLRTDDFADVMRNGLGAIVAWFNADAGNTEPEEVEHYSLRVELSILDNGCGEAAVYNEGKYLGEVSLSEEDLTRVTPLASQPGKTVGDTRFTMSSIADGSVIRQQRWDGSTWQDEALSHQVITRLNLARLRAKF